MREIWPLAVRAGEKLGVNPRAIVAQAALETGWGTRLIRDDAGVSGNNLFGIKADSRWAGERVTVTTLEYEGGLPKPQRAPFRAYPDLAAGFEDYVRFLKGNPRYSEALQAGGNSGGLRRTPAVGRLRHGSALCRKDPQHHRQPGPGNSGCRAQGRARRADPIFTPRRNLMLSPGNRTPGRQHMSGTITNGLSALLAAQRALQTTSNNIANANTAGYVRQRIDFVEQPGTPLGRITIGAGVGVADVSRIYDQYLTDNLRSSTSMEQRYVAYGDFATRLDTILGNPDTGVSASVQRFFEPGRGCRPGSHVHRPAAAAAAGGRKPGRAHPAARLPAERPRQRDRRPADQRNQHHQPAHQPDRGGQR